jgi:hypothetical protein
MTGSLRNTVLTLTAVLLGVGNAACACVNAPAGAQVAPANAHLSATHAESGHDHHARHDRAAPDHGHECRHGDFSHCASNAAAKASDQVAFATPSSAPTKAALRIVDAQIIDFGLAARRASDAYQRHRRKENRISTPASLKIRLRN